MNLSCWRYCCAISALLSLSSCHGIESHQDSAPNIKIDLKKIKPAIPKYEKKSRYGNPKSYTVMGKTYHVLPTAEGYNKVGVASWYGTKFHGRLTSTREPYDMLKMTAASTELPIPCYVRVTNLSNKVSIIVRVNDRGPFAHKRILDLSYAAAKKLKMAEQGTALVQVTAITIPAPEEETSSNSFQSTPTEQSPHLFWQVGAFSNKENAEQLAIKIIHTLKLPTEIVPIRIGNDRVYAVHIGPMPAYFDGNSWLIQRFKKMGIQHHIKVYR